MTDMLEAQEKPSHGHFLVTNTLSEYVSYCWQKKLQRSGHNKFHCKRRSKTADISIYITAMQSRLLLLGFVGTPLMQYGALKETSIYTLYIYFRFFVLFFATLYLLKLVPTFLIYLIQAFKLCCEVRNISQYSSQ